MNQKLRSDLILLFASIIWGFAFVAQRMGMEFVGPFTFTAVRFTLGFVVLLPFVYFRTFNTKSQSHRVTESQSHGVSNFLASLRLSGEYIRQRRKLFLLQLLLGLILFGGISFQQYGLLYTTAGNAGFITGFYVVLVPVVGWFLGQKSHFTIWIGVVLAIMGLYFLSVQTNFTINRGDLYVGVCALFWTVHVLLVGYIAPRTDPIRIAVVQFIICSALSWIVAIGFEKILWALIVKAALPILYGGILSVAIGYTLQIIAQQKAHPAYASIILSLESVFAVAGGCLILGEPLTGRMILGCALILSGMIAVQLKGLTLKLHN
jgi:drug/metabolite transporter (DMT)-like permease